MSDNFVKVGAPVNGRQNYEFKNSANNQKVTYSIPIENVDKFEKIQKEFQDVVQSVDQAAVRDKIEAQGKKSEKNLKISTIIGAAVGALIPAITAICVKGSVVKRSIIGGLTALVGAGVGAFSGMYLGLMSAAKNVANADPSLVKINDLFTKVSKLGIRQEKQ